MTDKVPHDTAQGFDNTTVSEVKLSSSTAKHFAPTNIGIEDEYVYCSVAIPKDKLPIALQSNTEKKIIEQKAADKLLSDWGLASYATVNKHSFLIKVEKSGPNSGVPVAAQLNSKKYSAVVVVYRGKGKIDDDKLDEAMNGSKWINQHFDTSGDKAIPIRVWNSKTEKEKSDLRWHWTSVKFYNRSDKVDVQLALNGLHELSSDLEKTFEKAKGEIHAYHIPIAATTSSTFTMPELTIDSGPTTLPIENELRKDILRTLLETEHNSHPDVAVSANKFFDTENDPATPIDGLQLVDGKQRRLASISGDVPLLYENGCSKLFFKHEQTVASFMLDFFGNGRKLNSPHDSKKFTQALRGKRVKFLGPEGKLYTRPIVLVGPTLVKDVRDEAMHSAWPTQGQHELRESNLPCLDVGTEAYPKLMPPEQCILLPGQAFTDPVNNAIRAQLNTQRTENASAALVQTAYVVSSGTVAQADKTARKSALQGVLKEAFNQNVKVCFVQFNGDLPPEDVWEEFKNCLVNIPIDRMDRTVAWKWAKSIELDRNSSTSQWSAALKQVKDDHVAPGQTLIAVVLLGEGKDKFIAYENLKRIVDVEVGMQAYCLTIKHLKKNASDTVKEAAWKATGELVSRMSTRQLPNGPANTAATGLEIAIHIEETALPNQPSFGYLVVIAAKHALSSSGYTTSRELVRTGDMSKYDLAGRLSDFLSNKLKVDPDGIMPSQMTIIRSGYTRQQTSGEVQNESDKIQDAVRAHMPHGGQCSYLTLDHAAADTLVGQNDASKLSNSRTLVLTDAEIRSDGTTRFFRVHRPQHAQNDRTKLQTTAIGTILTGHRLDGTEFVVESKPPSRHDSAESLVASGRDDIPTPIVISSKFAAGLKLRTPHMRSSAIRNKENEIPGFEPGMAISPSSKPLSERRSPSNPETMRKISTGSDPFGPPSSPTATTSTAKTPSPLSERRIPSNPETMRKVSTESAPDGSPLSLTHNDTPARKRHVRKTDFGIQIPPVILQDPVVEQDSKKQEPLTTAEMERIGHLWRDHLLDLHDQKYPVVTHLAHAVAKRAKLHIKLVNGNPVLPPVHADVADTLYFL